MCCASLLGSSVFTHTAGEAPCDYVMSTKLLDHESVHAMVVDLSTTTCEVLWPILCITCLWVYGNYAPNTSPKMCLHAHLPECIHEALSKEIIRTSQEPIVPDLKL